MNILAIDTTGPVLSLALQTGAEIRVFHRELARPHDETLLPQVKRLLSRAGIGWSDLHALAAASGPGRFTGIRIGMAFGAVLADRLSIPALPVSRLEALAAKSLGRDVCAVLPGYRDEIFYQIFKRGRSGGLRPAAPPVWAGASDWQAARAAFEARGLTFIQEDVRARDLLPCAAGSLRSGRKPRFEPLYLKPASYERPAVKAS